MPVFAVFAVAVALIVQVPGEVGAVYRPAVVIEPQVADQVTAWLAMNCVCPIACIATVAGVTVTDPVLLVIVTVVEAVPALPVAVTVHEPVVAGA